jgi:short-subunit dehydrogenase
MKIANKNMLITGSSRGIGLAMARRAAKEKMHVHLLNRSDTQEVAAELKDLGAASVHSWTIDMGSADSINEFVEKFHQDGQRCDILMNNAGQLTGGLLEEQPIEKIYSMFQVNLVGLVHLTQALLPKMLELPEAKIINNASVSGLMYLPCASTYAASKAGVVAFTESLRNELEGTSVSTLLMVTPGVKTRMYDEISDLYGGHLDLKFLSSIPAEQWVDRVFQALKNDDSICWPSGQSYFGVKLGQHWPRMLARFVRPYFSR